MRIFWRILGYARPLGPVVPQYLVLISLATVFSVINLTALIPLLQVLFNEVESGQMVVQPSFSWTIGYLKNLFYYHLHEAVATSGRFSALYYICLLMVASVLLANLFRYLSQLILARVRVRVIQNLRNAAFLAITNSDVGFFSSRKKGDLISRVSSDVQEVEQSAVSALKIMVKEPFLIIGYFAVLFTISAELTLYTLTLVPLAGMAVSVVARRIRKWARQTQESLGQMNSTLDETITGIRIIKALAAQSYIRQRFVKEVKAYAAQSFNISKKANLASPISEVMGVAVLSVVLIIGGKMVLSPVPELSPAEFIGFLVIFSQVLVPAKAISVVFSEINRGIISASRVFDLVDSRPEIIESDDTRPIQTLERDIVFEGVSFAYEEQEVITQLNMTIPKGKIVALVGPSGGGKSTIADLLCRFYDPTHGSITVDGVDLRSLALNQWRGLIGLVSQQPLLFHDTIANNITFGRTEVSFAQIQKAAKAANADAFIEKLPQGYETIIGEMGNKLSGGERQRLTIARAILQDPPILILDEATSSLDAQSEEQVQQALFTLMKDRTTLVIAHRLSTIQHADEILVINKGRITERGTHDQLRATSGLYQQLTQLQSF
ncbi:ABC transporter ATP-binding protein [Marinoscillum luteum]|uniref:ABC transporter ATP-binding protein n=1 Tax=Marinoscillum luteum TaxID=861051 RepID=A0ABW7N972_9BACT